MKPEASRYQGWDVVAEVGQPYEAELIALRLRGGGIEAEILDEGMEQLPIPASADFEMFRIVVPTASADAARKILDELVSLPEDAESDD